MVEFICFDAFFGGLRNEKRQTHNASVGYIGV